MKYTITPKQEKAILDAAVESVCDDEYGPDDIRGRKDRRKLNDARCLAMAMAHDQGVLQRIIAKHFNRSNNNTCVCIGKARNQIMMSADNARRATRVLERFAKLLDKKLSA